MVHNRDDDVDRDESQGWSGRVKWDWTGQRESGFLSSFIGLDLRQNQPDISERGRRIFRLSQKIRNFVVNVNINENNNGDEANDDNNEDTDWILQQSSSPILIWISPLRIRKIDWGFEQNCRSPQHWLEDITEQMLVSEGFEEDTDRRSMILSETWSFVVNMNETAGDKDDDVNNKDTKRFFSKVDIPPEVVNC